MDDGRMDIDSGPTTGRRKSISFNPLTRSNSGSMYSIERTGKLPGSEYRKDISRRPEQVYGEPITEVRKQELWSNSSNLNQAKQEVKREGSPYVHLADEPSFIQAANNRVINQGINQEVQYFLKNRYNWNTIAEIFLSRLGSVSGVGTSDDMKDYQVIYYQMLNLVRDPSGKLQQRLIQAIDILGGYNRVGRARRKTRGRKKLRKTTRKSKQ